MIVRVFLSYLVHCVQGDTHLSICQKLASNCLRQASSTNAWQDAVRLISPRPIGGWLHAAKYTVRDVCGSVAFA